MTNPNLTPYPYNRTFSILAAFGENPTLDDSETLALWIREQNGQVCTVDGTGCVLSADFMTAVVQDTNWIRTTTPRTTRWPSHVKWVGITQGNRRTLEQVAKEFPRQG